MLERQSEASSASVVGMGIGIRGIDAKLGEDPMRIRHAGEKSNWRGQGSVWGIVRATGSSVRVAVLCSGTLLQP